jgi:predicted metal-dependent hydrolase
MLKEIGVRFGVDMTGVPCIGDGIRDLQAAEGVGAQPMLVLTGKGEKTLREGNIPKSTMIFPDLAFAAVGAPCRRLKRHVGAALARLPSLSDRRHAVLRGRDAALLLAAADSAYKMAASWCAVILFGRALDLRDPLSDGRPREHPVDAAHRAVEAQLDLGDARAHAILSASRVCGEEGAPVDSFLRLGLQARLADHDRSEPGTDAMQQIAVQGRERFGKGFWIVLYPKERGFRRGRAQSTRPAVHASLSSSASRWCRSRTTRVICGPKACSAKSRHAHRIDRKAHSVAGRDAQTLMADVENWIENEVARLGKPVGARRNSIDGLPRRHRGCGERAASRRDLLRGPHRGEDRRADGQSRSIVLVDQRVDYRLVRARRRTIGMQIGLDGLTVRAPRWVTIARSRRRSASATRGSCGPSPSGERDAATSAERVENGRADTVSGHELELAVHPRAHKEITADLINLTVLHPAADDESQVAAFVGRWLRDQASRMLAPLVTELAATGDDASADIQALQRALRMGKLQRARCHSPELAARSPAAPPRALHRRPRGGASRRAQSFARFWNVVETLHAGHADARRALDDWTALLEADAAIDQLAPGRAYFAFAIPATIRAR